MELMSSLLLCALAALLPQALGVKSSFISSIKREAPKYIETPLFHKTVWLKRKTPSEVTLETLMDYLYDTEKCALCLECINKALHFMTTTKPTDPPRHIRSGDFMLNDVVDNYHQYKVERNKRDAEISPVTAKNNNVSKSRNVTVTKYNIDGQIYAIKLKERNLTANQEKSCQVFSIRKYYPCDSPKAESIFLNARRKKSKRTKMPTTSMTSSTTEKSHQSTVFGDKAPEPFMTSIEELYN